MNKIRAGSRRASVVRTGAVPPVLLCAALVAAGAAQARNDDPTAMSLEALLQVPVVAASKYEQKQGEVAAAVSVLTRQQIRAFGWRTLEEALGSLPGIHVTYDRQYVYLGTRGFGLPGDYNTRVLVTVNGNRLNDPIYDGGPLGRQLPLDLDLVERIEFIPGPGGAVYGQNAMFGVINLITRSGAAIGGMELSADYAQPQRRREARVSWGGQLAGGLDVLLSVAGMKSRGEDRFFEFGASGAAGVAAGLDGERDREFFGRVSGAGWSFDLIYGNWRKDDPTGAYLSDPLVPGQYQGDRYVVGQLSHERGFAGGRVQLLTRLFAGEERYDSRLSYGTLFSFPARGDWYGAELRLVTTALDGHRLMFGLEAQDGRRQEQQALDLANPANDLLVRSDGHRLGLYLQDEWRLAEAWLATLGLRADRDATGRHHVSPRAGLIWNASAAATLKALYGRASRAPNAFERDYADGLAQVANPALRGETIDTLELVGDYRVSRNFALRAALYRWDMRRLITLGIDPASGLSQYQSGADVAADGVELSADHTWDGGVRLRASLSLQDVAPVDGSQLVNSPRRLARVNLSGPLPRVPLRAAAELQYDGSRHSLDGSMLPGYTLVNLALHGTLGRGVELSLALRNLLDRRYAHSGADTNWQNALEQDGRSALLRLVWAL